jgi:hypothetical protein
MFIFKVILAIGITLNFLAYLAGGNKNWGE